jgi:hypothetical protein
MVHIKFWLPGAIEENARGIQNLQGDAIYNDSLDAMR